MPKNPIKSRTLLIIKLRDGTYRLSDWNIVNTSLGAMLEPRSQRTIDGGKVVNRDPYDMENFNDFVVYNEDKMWSEFGTSGFTIPRDFTVA